MNDLEKQLWLEERGYRYPWQRSKAKGLTYLWRIGLEPENIETLDKVLENFPQMLLVCPACNRLYNGVGWSSDPSYTEKFSCPNPKHPKNASFDFDIVFNVIESDGIELDAPRGVCFNCGEFFNKDSELNLHCPHDGARLEFFARGSERAEIVFLHILEIANCKLFHSTNYFNAFLSIKSADVFLRWLTKEKYLLKKAVPENQLELYTEPDIKPPTPHKPAAANWYKISRKGKEYINQLFVKVSELQNSLRALYSWREACIKSYVSEWRFKGKRNPFGRHVHQELLENIYEQDFNYYISKLTQKNFRKCVK